MLWTASLRQYKRFVGDGAEWIWNRASMFVRRCEILDFWHAWNMLGLRAGKV